MIQTDEPPLKGRKTKNLIFNFDFIQKYFPYEEA